MSDAEWFFISLGIVLGIFIYEDISLLKEQNHRFRDALKSIARGCYDEDLCQHIAREALKGGE